MLASCFVHNISTEKMVKPAGKFISFLKAIHVLIFTSTISLLKALLNSKKEENTAKL